MNERTQRAIEGLRVQQGRIESSLLLVATASGQFAEITKEAAEEAREATRVAKRAAEAAEKAAEAAERAAEAAERSAEAAERAADTAERAADTAGSMHSALLTLKEETIRGGERTDALLDAMSDVAHTSADQEKWRRKADRKFEWMESWIREHGGFPPEDQEEAS